MSVFFLSVFNYSFSSRPRGTETAISANVQLIVFLSLFVYDVYRGGTTWIKGAFYCQYYRFNVVAEILSPPTITDSCVQ